MTKGRLSGRQAGFSLVELLVSLAIGLVISIAVITAYLSAAGAARVAEATGRMNEDAQAALTIMTQQLRMAGVNPAQPNRNTTTLHNLLSNPYIIRGCDTTFSNVTSATTTAALTCPNGASPSSISIGYEADRYNTVPTNAGVPTDCLGNGLTGVSQTVTTSLNVVTTTTVYEAENRFFIGTSTYITSPSLYCKGNAASTNPQPLVENIENMRITYGVSNPGQPRSFGDNSPGVAAKFVLGYMTAAELIGSTAALNGSLTFSQPSMWTPTWTVAFPTTSTFSLSDLVSGTGFAFQNGVSTGAMIWKAWDAVQAVRVCVLVRSENAAVFDSPAQYLDCSGNLVTPTDRRMRRAYTTTVLLRNQ
ncbi:MAG: PilW family protein [Comamonadaceae bacterium]|uniref:PilW family protein n=1 Tax=Candidatus Skiveiella danica TaxID=3386177 RepID=UPI001B57F8DB|nr:PilW family protein [Comamonadaceae bacterium]MBK7508635.1 PilW family protein [Comamonadaceae bacterium]MBK9200115.1 PilW family protein [Betaproteobacteria bacterium]MBP6483894.1 PilW family protein [Rhodoferax sp.]MBP6504726.1 PilW family protein [Rhodoferax sp.]